MGDILEFNGVQYRIGKLDAFKQFHIARRIAPILSTVAKAAADIPQPDRPVEGEEPTEEAAARWFAGMAAPLAAAFAEMEDEAADYILMTALSAVFRDAGKGTWAPVLSRQKTLMYQDIDMSTMVQLAVAVIRENLAGFFSSILASSEVPGEAKAASS